MQALSSQERARLARVAWQPTLGPFGCFERTWTFRTDDQEVAGLLSDLYADLLLDDAVPSSDTAVFSILSASPDQLGLVSRDGHRLGEERADTMLLGTLVWGVNRWVLDVVAGARLLLHAGAVTRSDGVGVLLPAESGSGKSTLTAELLARGLGYLSDEAVAVSDDGALAGYAKPISIDHGAFELLGDRRPADNSVAARFMQQQWHVRVSTFAAVAYSGQLGAVIFPRYVPEVSTTLRSIPATDAVVRAAKSTFVDPTVGHTHVWQLRRLAATIGTVPAFELVSSDLQRAGEAVQHVLEDLPAPYS